MFIDCGHWVSPHPLRPLPNFSTIVSAVWSFHSGSRIERPADEAKQTFAIYGGAHAPRFNNGSVPGWSDQRAGSSSLSC